MWERDSWFVFQQTGDFHFFPFRGENVVFIVWQSVVLKTDVLFVWAAVTDEFVGCFQHDNNRASDFWSFVLWLPAMISFELLVFQCFTIRGISLHKQSVSETKITALCIIWVSVRDKYVIMELFNINNHTFFTQQVKNRTKNIH